MNLNTKKRLISGLSNIDNKTVQKEKIINVPQEIIRKNNNKKLFERPSQSQSTSSMSQYSLYKKKSIFPIKYTELNHTTDNKLKNENTEGTKSPIISKVISFSKNDKINTSKSILGTYTIQKQQIPLLTNMIYKRKKSKDGNEVTKKTQINQNIKNAKIRIDNYLTYTGKDKNLSLNKTPIKISLNKGAIKITTTAKEKNNTIPLQENQNNSIDKHTLCENNIKTIHNISVNNYNSNTYKDSVIEINTFIQNNDFNNVIQQQKKNQEIKELDKDKEISKTNIDGVLLPSTKNEQKTQSNTIPEISPLSTNRTENINNNTNDSFKASKLNKTLDKDKDKNLSTKINKDILNNEYFISVLKKNIKRLKENHENHRANFTIGSYKDKKYTLPMNNDESIQSTPTHYSSSTIIHNDSSRQISNSSSYKPIILNKGPLISHPSSHYPSNITLTDNGNQYNYYSYSQVLHGNNLIGMDYSNPNSHRHGNTDYFSELNNHNGQKSSFEELYSLHTRNKKSELSFNTSAGKRIKKGTEVKQNDYLSYNYRGVIGRNLFGEQEQMHSVSSFEDKGNDSNSKKYNLIYDYGKISKELYGEINKDDTSKKLGYSNSCVCHRKNNSMNLKTSISTNFLNEILLDSNNKIEDNKNDNSLKYEAFSLSSSHNKSGKGIMFYGLKNKILQRENCRTNFD